MTKKLRLAAERVMRMSQPGSSRRFFTLVEVANESGLSVAAIVVAIKRIKSESERPTRGGSK
jgi:hypothetical protein